MDHSCSDCGISIGERLREGGEFLGRADWNRSGRYRWNSASDVLSLLQCLGRFGRRKTILEDDCRAFGALFLSLNGPIANLVLNLGIKLSLYEKLSGDDGVQSQRYIGPRSGGSPKIQFVWRTLLDGLHGEEGIANVYTLSCNEQEKRGN